MNDWLALTAELAALALLIGVITVGLAYRHSNKPDQDDEEP